MEKALGDSRYELRDEGRVSPKIYDETELKVAPPKQEVRGLKPAQETRGDEEKKSELRRGASEETLVASDN